MIQDEVFGPVITVQRFTDEDEAVRWANGVEYGLASSSGPATTAGRCG
jgi:betaine-aldehyde dehydrogenase